MEKVLSSGRSLPSKGVGVRAGPPPISRTDTKRPDVHHHDEVTPSLGRPGGRTGQGDPRSRR
jgi:hypothetical protein